MGRYYKLDVDHANSFSISCEYEDGSTITQFLSEERSHPDLTEIHSPEASGAQRVFYCNWGARFEVVRNMLGFAVVKQKAGSFPDATGWNGKYVHRRLPMGYGLGRSLTDATKDWVYATRATVAPNGQKSNYYADGRYLPSAPYARVEIQFSAPDYKILEDSEVAFTGSSGGGAVSCGQEWMRYARITQKPASQFFQYPGHALKLVDYPTAAAPTKKALHFWPPIIDNVADLWLEVFDLPYDPTPAIYHCYGKINATTIFVTPDMPLGHPPETLHFVAADITRQVPRCGQMYWSMKLGFKKVFNRDLTVPLEVGADPNDPASYLIQYRGHNYVRDLVFVDLNTRALRFFRVSQDGTASTAGENPMIGLENFGKLFWIR